MSVFFCDECQDIQDSDFVGYNVIGLDRREVCDDALSDIEEDELLTAAEWEARRDSETKAAIPDTVFGLMDLETEYEVFDPKTGMFDDEDNHIMDDPYFDLHTDAGPY